MDTIDGLRAFVATAQTGSFTGAADQLGMSNRLTSKYVGELEARLGVRLFQRTTRKVGLTPAGETLLSRATALLEDLDDVFSDLTEESQGFTGMLRVSAPTTFGELYVAGMLGRFAKCHAGLVFDLRLDDRYVDMAADGFDLAFRIGATDTLSMKSRKLGELPTYLVASPEYLEHHGTPRTPADLASHMCILDSNWRQPRRWTFYKDGIAETVGLNGTITVNSARAAGELAASGNGIAYSPSFAVGAQLKTGRLVQLLDGFSGETSPVSAVYLEGQRLPRKTRALIEFAVEDFRSRQSQ